MCQYSATNGVPNDWHLAHLGQFAMGKAGLIMAEATAISADARSTLFDTGIWNNEQVSAWSRIVTFIHQQGSMVGLQLWHAGRKGSATTPWQGHEPVSIEDGGWVAVAPSPIPFGKLPIPKELTKTEILRILDDYRLATENALKAGFDVIEIHGAHGYLIHSFLSPLANKRVDEYGGNFDGRSRFVLEVTDAIRSVWPADKPLFIRMSTIDWIPEGWSIQDTIQLAELLEKHGVDLIDCSSGGIVPDTDYETGPNYQVPFAAKVRADTQVLTAAVGLITDPLKAQEIIETGQADAVMLGREMLRNPHWALHAAFQLGIDIEWPNQYKQAKPREKWPY
jgi:2,4-dienoyl-CoA reductase-like NADH-dependent reductase (Old Yellow Enzyme family)